MRPSEFWTEREIPGVDPWGPGRTEQVLDIAKLDAIVAGPLPEHRDIETAVALARFVHDQYESFGTNKEGLVSEDESNVLIRTLKALLGRLGITGFDPPFRDFKSFYNHWLRNDGHGSWQARRDILDEIFEPLHRTLDEREAASISSTLAAVISPRRVTGWPRVDEEISELRRHFESATTAQDYSNVGNDCVSTLEALAEVAYNHDRHGREGEGEPPVAKTKDRLDRFVETELTGPGNAEMRKLARATIEVAQAVKHRRETTTRTDAGIAADSVILLANMLRRIAATEP